MPMRTYTRHHGQTTDTERNDARVGAEAAGQPPQKKSGTEEKEADAHVTTQARHTTSSRRTQDETAHVA
eukprot:SAG11_NODE_2462_length_3327_cov_2.195167_1_plen_69_part_00